jgi:hypothetical protein
MVNPKYFGVTKQLECRACAEASRQANDLSLKSKAGVFCLQCFFYKEMPICMGMCDPCFDKHVESFKEKVVGPSLKRKHVKEVV